MKICEILDAKNQGEISWSLEFFPPKTDQGAVNLMDRVERMKDRNFMFLDLTWGAGGSTSERTLELSKVWQSGGHQVNMHLTCTNMEMEKLQMALKEADQAGIDNLVTLRGDPPHGEEKWEVSEGGFACGLDLVRFVREHYGDRFCLSVAGYPEGHPDQIVEVPESELETLSERELGRLSSCDGKYYVCPEESYQADLMYLKAKVEAGGNLIITQLFYDCEVFLQFVNDCRQIGITCPILPGIMLVQNYGGFKKMTAMCHTRVPTWLVEKMEEFKESSNDEIRKFGTELAIQMCQQLFAGGIDHFHLYTLNQEQVANSVIDYLESLNRPPLDQA